MAKISVNNLASAIYESLKNKEGSDFDLTTQNIINFIRDKHMLGRKDLILEAIEKIIDKENNTIRIKVSTKNKISDIQKKEIEEFIKKKYKAKEVILETKENEKLLGGIKTEIEDEIIDLTLKNKLNQLQNYLITTK